MHQSTPTIVKTIVFTDLDGTLIDFESYSHKVAGPLARKLVRRKFPLVFCSSKTLEEQLHLMKEMGLSTPCIVENGCGIFVPENFDLLSDQPSKAIPGFGKLVKLGVSNLKIQKAIAKLSLDMGIDFRPYSKLTPLKISKITGLSEAATQRAQNREFSETLTASLDHEVWKEVNTKLNEVDLQCLCGGRFYTVTSKEYNKGTAMKMLLDAYRASSGGNWKSIAIGDSANDHDMLQSADQGYLVQKTDGSWDEMDIPRLKQISGIGPHGWVEAIRDAIGLVP